MINIINLGHSSFLIKNENVSFVIDPYQDGSVPGLRFPRISANYVFKSHDHHDHNATELVRIVPTDIELKYETVVVPHDHHGGEHRGLNKMHIFYIDGLKIIHTGDLGCIPDKNILEKMQNADVLFAPIDGFYTISAQELHEIMKLVNPRIVIPMHYYKGYNNSGYPDGGQINIFKSLVKDYLEVNENSINISDDLFNHKVVIFNNELQEGK